MPLCRSCLGDLLVVAGAAVAVPVADLGDSGHADRVVQAPVPAHRQAVDDPVAGGHLDRRGAVIGGETVPPPNRDTSRTSPITVAAMTGPTPKDLSQRRAGRTDRRGQLLVRLPQQGVGAAQAGHELGGQFGAGLGHGAARLGLLPDLGGVSCVYLFADAAGGIRSHSAACSRRQATWVRARLRRGAAWPISSARPGGHRP